MAKKKAVQKTATTTKGPVYEKVAIPQDLNKFVKISLKLVNFSFDNNSFDADTSLPVDSIIRRIRETVGTSAKIRVWKGSVNETNLIENTRLSLADLGVEGSANKYEPKLVTFYYDFSDQVESNPLLLMTPRAF